MFHCLDIYVLKGSLSPLHVRIVLSTNCNIIFFTPFEQTHGLKHGRAIVISTCAAVASIVTGVLAGMLALGEQLPSAPVARLSLLLGWYMMLT